MLLLQGVPGTWEGSGWSRSWRKTSRSPRGEHAPRGRLSSSQRTQRDGCSPAPPWIHDCKSRALSLLEATSALLFLTCLIHYCCGEQCCGSGMFIPDLGSEFFHSGSQVKKSPDPRSRILIGIKNLSIFLPKHCLQVLRNMIRDVHAGSGY
jgi:hypothetical protein